MTEEETHRVQGIENYALSQAREVNRLTAELSAAIARAEKAEEWLGHELYLKCSLSSAQCLSKDFSCSSHECCPALLEAYLKERS